MVKKWQIEKFIPKTLQIRLFILKQYLPNKVNSVPAKLISKFFAGLFAHLFIDVRNAHLKKSMQFLFKKGWILICK